MIMGSDNPNMIYSPVSLNTALDTYSCMIGQNEAFDEIRSFIGNINYRRYHDVMDSDTGVYRIINRMLLLSNILIQASAASGAVRPRLMKSST